MSDSSSAMACQPACRLCGKPEHGSLACSIAPDWPTRQTMPYHQVSTSCEQDEGHEWEPVGMTAVGGLYECVKCGARRLTI